MSYDDDDDDVVHATSNVFCFSICLCSSYDYNHAPNPNLNVVDDLFTFNQWQPWRSMPIPAAARDLRFRETAVVVIICRRAARRPSLTEATGVHPCC